MGTVTMVNEPTTETEGDTPPEVTPEPDTGTVVEPTVPAEEPAAPAEVPVDAPVEEPAPETAPEEPAVEPSPEAVAEASADIPKLEGSVMNVVTTDGAFGYVTVSGKVIQEERRMPVVLKVTGGPETRWFSDVFAVTVIADGTFEMTVHLPPGNHEAVLLDDLHIHAKATFSVV